MAKKYIDAEKLKKIVEQAKQRALKGAEVDEDMYCDGRADAFEEVLLEIDSLQQEQPDFPTTDEQMKEFLATHPKIKVPEKYKNPDWLFKKLEQPEVDLEKEIETWISTHIKVETGGIQQVNTDELAKTVKEWGKGIARRFFELGLNAKEENK